MIRYLPLCGKNTKSKEKKKVRKKVKIATMDIEKIVSVTNFIWTYLYQFFNDFYSLNNSRKPLRRPFD